MRFKNLFHLWPIVALIASFVLIALLLINGFDLGTGKYQQ